MMRWDVDLKSCLLFDGDEDVGSAMWGGERGGSKAGPESSSFSLKRFYLCI